MLIGQAINWPEILNHSVAIGVVIFFGLGLTWLTKRLFGENGIITKTTERNSATMEKYGETLVELKDLNANQQLLCTSHAGSMKMLESFSGEMIRLHNDPSSVFSTTGVKQSLNVLDGKIDEHSDYHQTMHGKWGKVNPAEFRVPPVLDAILHIIDTAEELAPTDDDGDAVAKLRLLRKNIEGVKAKMKGD